jgi:hypothetical protein
VRIRNWIVAGLSVAALVGGVGWAWAYTGQPDVAPSTATTVTPPKANDTSHSQSQRRVDQPPITEIPEYAQEPSPPSVSITCPTDGYGNKIYFGGEWEVFTQRATVAIDYGDGRSYKTSRLSYFDSAYWHTYRSPGTFTVRIVLTDAAGQSASDSCVASVLPEPTYIPPSYNPPSYNSPSYDPPRLPNGHIDHDWPTFPGPGSSSRPIQPYPALPGDPNDRDGDGVACEYGCKD